MAKQVKKALSLILAISMILSMMQVAAFATDSGSQIVSNGHTDYFKDNGTTGTTGNYAAAVSKTIAGTANENEFNITLQVKTTQDLDEIKVSPDAAVILVMDTSTSMVNNKENGITRLAKAKTAASNFLSSYVTDAGTAKRMVSIVEFGDNAKTVLPWTEANAGGNAVAASVTSGVGSVANKFGYSKTTATSFIRDDRWADWDDGDSDTCSICGLHDSRHPDHQHCTYPGCTMPTNTSHTHDVVTTHNDGGGTNIEGGLMLARNLLTAGTATGGAIENIDSVYVILLTDGKPTAFVSERDTSTTETSFLHFSGNGTETNKTDYEDVPAIATTIKSMATLYSISYATSGQGFKHYGSYISVDTWLSDIVGVNHNYSAANGTAVATNLQSISTIIRKLTQAWMVTDPMGNFINFDHTNLVANGGSFSTSPDSVNYWDSANNKLVWNLRDDIPTGSGAIGDPYTYTLTYKVTLNTSASGFVTGQDYATNGTTSLKYLIVASQDELRGLTSDEIDAKMETVNFTVPQVEGAVPTVNYSIEYYKQGTATTGDFANYEKVTADTRNREADLWTTAVLADQDSGYETKYNYYTVAQADTTKLLNQDGLVLKVYYNHQTAAVTVNHYLTTTAYAADGAQTVTTNVLQTNETVNTTVNKGEPYNADKLSDRNTAPYNSYVFDAVASDPTTISNVTADNNTINLYYTLVTDARALTNVTVFHQYNTYEWVLGTNGVYTKTLVSGTPVVYTSAQDLRATAGYSASTADVTLADGTYTYNSSAVANSGATPLNVTQDVGNRTASITLGEADNTMTLTFVKDVPAPSAAAATIKITHHYTKNVTTIVGGVPVTDTSAPADIVEYLPVSGNCYEGERYTVNASKTQPDGAGTDSYAVNGDSSRQITLTAGENAVTFHYDLSSAPAQTTATVQHIYRTFEEYTTPEGTTNTREKVDACITEDAITIPNLYVGQDYTASLNPSNRTGYTVNDIESSPYTNAVVLGNGGLSITIYYDKDEVEDNRVDASVTVTHTYTTKLSTVVGGVATVVDRPAGTTSETLSGKVGDSYTAAVQTSYNGHDNWTRTDASSLTGVYTAGTNPTVALTYERSDSNLVSATYVANYYYYDWTMTVENGIAGYYDGASKVLSDSSVGTAQDSYQSVQVSLGDGARIGYTADSNNPSTNPTLDAGSNVYDFYFVKQIPLSTVNVAVTHNYSLTTISATGVSTTEPTSASGIATPATIYAGADVTVQAAFNGYTTLDSVTVTSSGNSVTYTQDSNTKAITFPAPSADATVVFHYAKTVDNSVGNEATYSIQHYYRTKDWNGTYSDYVLDENNGTNGNSYATLTVTGTPDYKLDGEGNPTYSLDTVDATGGTLTDGTYTQTIAAGTNTMKFYYTKAIDTREVTTVTVNHIYRVLDSNVTGGYVSESTIQEEFSYVKDGAYVGNNFTATPRTVNGTHTYTSTISDPVDGKKTLVADAASNVINIIYTRNYGEGDLFNVYGNKTYVGLSQSQYPTTTIYLMQNGTAVYSTVVDAEGSFTFQDVAPGTYTLGERANASGYTCSAQYQLVTHSAESNGPTYTNVTSITVNADYVRSECGLLITNTYTAISYGDDDPTPTPKPTPTPTPTDDPTEIPITDPETPLTELPTETEEPEEEIADEAVPQADVPQTGDTSALRGP